MKDRIPPKYRTRKWAFIAIGAVCAVAWGAYAYFSVPVPPAPAVPAPVPAQAAPPAGPAPSPMPAIPQYYNFLEFTKEWQACYEQVTAKGTAATKIKTVNAIVNYIKEQENNPVEKALLADVKVAAQDLLKVLSNRDCNEEQAGHFYRVEGRAGWLVEQAEWSKR